MTRGARLIAAVFVAGRPSAPSGWVGAATAEADVAVRILDDLWLLAGVRHIQTARFEGHSLGVTPFRVGVRIH